MTQLKAILARFEIPTTLTTDNGPQFDSHGMKEFPQTYDFRHTTTNPYYPPVNGFAGRTVYHQQIVKIFSKSIQSTTQL